MVEPDALDAQLEQELAHLRSADRLRSCPELTGSDRVHPRRDGRKLLAFTSNDYLGLTSHPALRDAAREALDDSGAGASGSRLVSGDLPEHRMLEQSLATYLDRPSALVFPSGYQANLGALTALAGPDDLIVSDALNHASLIDGCRLSRARVERYKHRDASDAARALATTGDFRRRLLVTESLFSMDGDVAPLAELDQLARRHTAILIVDEAHAVGVMGPNGRGICAAEGVSPAVFLGTLGKAFGAGGGFVAGSATLRRYLVNRARTFLFTTGLAPATAAAAAAGVAVSAGHHGTDLRARLFERIVQLRAGLGFTGWPREAAGAILPIVLGPDEAATAASHQLLESGIFVQAIRPPTVPEGTARLRVTLSALHSPDEVDCLIRALRALVNR